jgi:hypothetical protein
MGRTHEIPSEGSLKTTATGDEATRLLTRRKVRETLEKEKGMALPKKPTIPSVEEAALGGTGPYRKIGAMIEGFAGGLGADKLWGAKGIFPETAENRQSLKMFRNKVYGALKNSERGAVYDQKMVFDLAPNPDAFWRNPRIEARKVDDIVYRLLDAREANMTMLGQTSSPEKMEKLMASNVEIDSLLKLLTPKTPEGIMTPEEQAVFDKY